MEKKINIFKSNLCNKIHLLRCVLCGSGFELRENSMVCGSGHTYDIAKKGYVNLFGRPSKVSETYDRSLFSARNTVSYLYDGLCNKLNELIGNYPHRVILDAGCGCGNITAKLLNADALFGVDLSKEGMEFAASNYGGEIIFIVGNINELPLKDGTADIILNVMSPSNYSEFKRILRNGGILIKVIVEPEYLSELRNFIYKDDDRNKYTNDDVYDNIGGNMNITDTYRLTYQCEIGKEHLSCLFDMTPLTKGIAAREEIRRDFINSFDSFAVTMAFKIVVCGN